MTLGTPKPERHDFVHTEHQLRWVTRSEQLPGAPEGVGQKVMVLQERIEDGWGKYYWSDVPIRDEEEE